MQLVTLIPQQRETQGINNLKMREQIKTMISITSCNLDIIGQVIWSQSAGEAKLWKDQVERKR